MAGVVDSPDVPGPDVWAQCKDMLRYTPAPTRDRSRRTRTDGATTEFVWAGLDLIRIALL